MVGQLLTGQPARVVEPVLDDGVRHADEGDGRRVGQAGVCVRRVIDDRAREYLPHMYGPANFTLVDRVEKLPFNVSDIYRRLTR